METKSKMKRNDWILLVLVLAAALLICVIQYFTNDEQPGYVSVSINGEVVDTYDLSEDREIVLNNGTNIMKIEDHKADMVDAECPDKLCVSQKAVSKNGESIICLPNKVVLQIVSQDETGLDAVTN